MKKILSISTAALMLSALFMIFAGCSGSNATLVGTWEGEEFPV